MNRFNKVNADDSLKGKLLDKIVNVETLNEQNIIYGVVVNNNDPLNANRVKIRIPKLDDSFFRDGDEYNEGINNLPWCLPVSRNFISTPEQNSIVAVQLINPKTPSIGRIYIDCLTDLSDKDLFEIERLQEEFKTYLNFENLEKATNIKTQLGDEIKEEDENIKFNVGIRGKGKNKVLLTKESIEITQNDENDESKIIINKNIIVETSNELHLISKKGKTNYHPVFHSPLYDYINDMNNIIKSMALIHSTLPSTCAACGAPNLPNPSAQKLVSDVVQLYKNFVKLKIDGNGHSKYVWVN